MTLVDHGDGPHAHLIVGNISRASLDPIIRDWRRLAGGSPSSARVKPVSNPWGWIHYMCSQHKNAAGRTTPAAHARDRFSYCPALLGPPIESPNLEVVSVLVNRILRSARGRKSRRDKVLGPAKARD